MSGIRLIVGVVVMGIAVPLTIFFLLQLDDFGDFFTIAATTFMTWGIADFLSTLLERPRLKDRTPGRAIREDWERRAKD